MGAAEHMLAKAFGLTPEKIKEASDEVIGTVKKLDLKLALIEIKLDMISTHLQIDDTNAKIRAALIERGYIDDKKRELDNGE